MVYGKYILHTDVSIKNSPLVSFYEENISKNESVDIVLR